jgi:hypothetical protein
MIQDELKYGELKNTQTIVQVEYQRESGLRNTQTIVQVEYSDDTFHLIESVSFDDSIEQFLDVEILEDEISLMIVFNMLILLLLLRLQLK